MHGDGAPELTGIRMQVWLRLKGVHLTWRAPHEPRGNGMMERQWRTICRDARAARATSNLPAEWWWYCFRQAVETSWVFEIPGHPCMTPWRRWTGAKPRCMGIRPIGCLAYVKEYFPGNKSNERGVRTINCGRCPTQPGYQCWDPVRKRMLVSPHVTFDENVFPGLYRTAGGWDAVGTPHYARSSGGDPSWRPAGEDGTTPPPPPPRFPHTHVVPDPSTDEDLGEYTRGRNGGPPPFRENGGPDHSLGGDGGGLPADFELDGADDGDDDAAAAPVRPNSGLISSRLRTVRHAPRPWGADSGAPLQPHPHAHAVHSPVLAHAVHSPVLEAWDLYFAGAPEALGELAGCDTDMLTDDTLSKELAELRIDLSPEGAGEHEADDIPSVHLVGAPAEDSPSCKEAMKGADAHLWRDACKKEIESLQNHDVFRVVAEDSLPTWNPTRRTAYEVVNILWVLKRKLNELREVVRYKARAVFDGAEQKRKAAAAGVNLKTSAPTCRQGTHKAHCAVIATQGLEALSFDVEAAYLRGKSTSPLKTYARPPQGFQSCLCHACNRQYAGGATSCPACASHKTTPLCWDLHGNLYGKCDAGYIWYMALVHQLVVCQGFRKSENDPCLFTKTLAPGRNMNITIYVDDGLSSFHPQDRITALRELEIFNKVYTITIKEPVTYFLGGNITVSPGKVSLSSATYIAGLLSLLPRPVESYPRYDVPATADFYAKYEAAVADGKPSLAPELSKTYAAKVGAILYASPQSRADTAYAIGILARCMHCPTRELDLAADRVIVFLWQNLKAGPTYSAQAPRSRELHAFSDSDWEVSRSTTGWVIFFGGAAIAWGSNRQHSIALSSTEAEIMAASVAANEIVHLRKLLRDFGFVISTATILYVDNTGAVELANNNRTTTKSRHIHRRYLKVREYVEQGEIVVVHVNTELNTADIFTKPLASEPFTRHTTALFGPPG